MLPLTHSLAHTSLRMSRTSDALSAWYSHPSFVAVAEAEQPQLRHQPQPQLPSLRHKQQRSLVSYAESEPADDGEQVSTELEDGAPDANLRTLEPVVRCASDSQFSTSGGEQLLLETGDDAKELDSRRGSQLSNRLRVPDIRIRLFGGGRENGAIPSNKFRKNSISESERLELDQIPRRKRTGSLIPQSASGIAQLFNRRHSKRQNSPPKQPPKAQSTEMRTCATQTLESSFATTTATASTAMAQKNSECQTESLFDNLCNTLPIESQALDSALKKPSLEQQMSVSSTSESMFSAQSEPHSPTATCSLFIIKAPSIGSRSRRTSTATPAANVNQLTDPKPLNAPPEQQLKQSSPAAAAFSSSFSSRSESFSSAGSGAGRRHSKSKSPHKSSHSRKSSTCEPPIALGMIAADFDVCTVQFGSVQFRVQFSIQLRVRALNSHVRSHSRHSSVDRH